MFTNKPYMNCIIKDNTKGYNNENKINKTILNENFYNNLNNHQTLNTIVFLLFIIRHMTKNHTIEF